MPEKKEEISYYGERIDRTINQAGLNRTKKDISGLIEKIFQLEKDSFNPEIHFPMADKIVEALGHYGYTHDWYGIFKWEWEWKGQQYDAEKGQIDSYKIYQHGRLSGDYLGWYPKMQIIHWQDRFYNNPHREELWVAYEEKRTAGIMKAKNQRTSLIIPLGITNFTLNWDRPQKLWLYKR